MVQPPVLETNVRPAGVGSITVDDGDVEGPLFVTVMVYVIVPPGAAMGGPVFVTARSDAVATVAVVLDELLPDTGSVDVVVTLAVFTMVPVAVGDTE